MASASFANAVPCWQELLQRFVSHDRSDREAEPCADAERFQSNDRRRLSESARYRTIKRVTRSSGEGGTVVAQA